MASTTVKAGSKLAPAGRGIRRNSLVLPSKGVSPKNEFVEPVQRDLGSPVPRSKIFRLRRRANQKYNCRISSLNEGRWPSSQTLGWDAVDAAASGALGIAGRIAVSDSQRADERRCFSGFAKTSVGVHYPPKHLAEPARGRQNCVVLAPVAGVKSAEVFVSPTGSGKTANSPMTVTRGIRRREERSISR